MKTNRTVFALIVAMTAGATVLASAQQTTSPPNPVIGRPETSTPENPPSQSSTASKITSTVEGLLGRFLHKDSQLTLEQLPPPVQNTVRTEAGTAPIQGITPIVNNGQTNYIVAFTRNGQSVNLQVDPAGRIINGGQPAGSVVGAAPNIGSQAIGTRPDWRRAPARQPLSDVVTIDFRDLPQPVRDTFLRYAGPGAVDNLGRGTLLGQMVYQGQLHPNGQRIDLRVAETGALIDDQINDRFVSQFNGQQNAGLGRSGVWQSATGTSKSLAPLSNVTSVPFDQLPLAVQTTISGQLSGATVDRVSQGTLDGRTVYETTSSQGAQSSTLRVADDGSILSR